jgi:hypothetical protein
MKRRQRTPEEKFIAAINALLRLTRKRRSRAYLRKLLDKYAPSKRPRNLS